MTARDGNEAVRSWRQVAAELADEKDTARFENLAEELLKALDRAGTDRNSTEFPHPGSKVSGHGQRL
jgi:hypothetical protein